MKISLIALDLDDTLLDDNCIITEHTIKTIQELAGKGIYIVLCSGRAKSGILPFIRVLNIAKRQEGRYIISFNGAQIYNLHKRQVIYQDMLSPAILQFVYREAKKRGLSAVVYDEDTVYSGEDTEWARMDSKLCNLKFKIITPFLSFLNRPFHKILVPGEPNAVRAFQETLTNTIGDKVEVYLSKPFFLEVINKGCGKGESIRRLASYLKIPIEATMGFGDSMNDLSMIRLCGAGVAMKNSSDFIKKNAKFITEYSNNEEGVARFLEKYVLNSINI